MEDRILAGELAALGAVGGGGPLIRAVGRLMKKDVHEIGLHVPLPFGDVVTRVSSVLGKAGRAVEAVPVGGEGEGEVEETIRVVVGGGAAGMNPVVVTARVRRAGADGSEIRLRAAAKEGLIRQRAGEKTAVRLAALLAAETGTGG
ncbi:hypothetical protein DMH12_22025 [Streptomyces sp. WAC 04229]|uniref:hypothetical protein n=1 Tax=Streptomyces sp. WAC 04229 TaxID=2203206 RepID=UPI000F7393A3|nr:hypothetical protein [Streptomyces sp. WAC 04229]RSN51540.1 hypothetical protein DMH12_22025 [Streptomyces sp. WAC 04229]